MTGTFLTFNLQNQSEEQALRKAPKLAQTMRQSGAEAVLLQEVSFPLLRALDRELAPAAIVGVGREDGQEAGEFVPILVLNKNWKIEDNGWFWLGPRPEIPSRAWFALCPRICTWALISSRESQRPFLLINNHWDHFSFYSRSRGWEQILNLVEEYGSNYPVILGGDFNLGPNRPLFHRILKNSVRPLRDAWGESNPGRTDYTFAGWFKGWGRSRVDHFFLSSEWSIEKAEILHQTDRSRSDHDPLRLIASII